jgi:hypothetical protein
MKLIISFLTVCSKTRIAGCSKRLRGEARVLRIWLIAYGLYFDHTNHTL